jgi:N-acetylmuramic acid 6-phosphate etherase
MSEGRAARPSPGRPVTERPLAASAGLGGMSARQVVDIMTREELRVLDVVREASAELAVAAERVAATVMGGGTVVLIGAGTGGRLAEQEAAEVPATFGGPRERFRAITAGRFGVGAAAVTDSEDDEEAAPAALAAAGIGDGDAVIGVSASGRTSFVRSGIRAARAAGAWTCGLTADPDGPLLLEAEIGICLDTGPEVLTGSTRLKAGTAQKLALNRITTAAMVLAGRVRGNQMVELVGTNAKLRQRAVDVVAAVAEVSADVAVQALSRTGWSVRAALDVFDTQS